MIVRHVRTRILRFHQRLTTEIEHKASVYNRRKFKSPIIPTKTFSKEYTGFIHRHNFVGLNREEIETGICEMVLDFELLKGFLLCNTGNTILYHGKVAERYLYMAFLYNSCMTKGSTSRMQID